VRVTETTKFTEEILQGQESAGEAALARPQGFCHLPAHPPQLRESPRRSLPLLGSRPLTRVLLQEWKASMDGLAPSTVNVRLSAVRKLVEESRRNGLLSAEAAANLTDVPNIKT